MPAGRTLAAFVSVLLCVTCASGAPALPQGGRQPGEGHFPRRRLRQDVQNAEGARGADGKPNGDGTSGPLDSTTARNGYLVSIEKPCYPGHHLCTGAMIDRKWVLTTASCLHHLGDIPLAVRLSIQGRDIVEVVSRRGQVLHPGWTGSRAHGNDIALMKLERPLDGTLHPIPIVQDGIDILGGPILEMVRYAGEGRVRVKGVGLVPREGCNRLRLAGQHSMVADDMKCGFAPLLGDAAGLNGGLLVFTNASESPQLGQSSPRPGSLLGIASFDRTDRLDVDGLPVAFTCLLSFNDWIRDVINEFTVESPKSMPALVGSGSNSSDACPLTDIPGSEVAPPGRFPYTVSLRNSTTGFHFCVGTLVSPRWVLAPAHCMEGAGEGQTPLVVIGARNATDLGGQVRNATKVVLHPLWNLVSGTGVDVAMVKLNRPVKDVAMPRMATAMLALPPLLSVVGWPRDANTSMLAETLHYADLIRVPAEACTKFYAEDRLESTLCIGGVKPDVCEGVSAGPLLLANAPNDTVGDGDPSLDLVMGLVSFGPEPCTAPGVPIVFTRIGDNRVLRWINMNLEEPDRMITIEEQQRLDEALRRLAGSPENETTQRMVDDLLNRGADPNGEGDPNGGKPIHEAAMSDNLIVAEALIRAGAQLDLRKISSRDAALHIAAMRNSTRVARLLINSGASINQQNMAGRTPLHFAAFAGHTLIVKLLLVAGARWDLESVVGDMPLHLASAEDTPMVVMLLIAAGSDVHMKNKDGQTPLQIAAENGQVEVAAVLAMAGANQSEVDTGAICDTGFSTKCQEDPEGVTEKLRDLLAPEESTETQGPDEVLLQVASLQNTTAQDVKDLLGDGASANACCNFLNGTALHEATRSDNAPVAVELINAGADINAPDSTFLNTPLHDAARWNAPAVAGALIDAGADMNAINSFGATPLYLSAEWGATEVAVLLVSRGALVELINSTGEFPLHGAVRGESKAIVNLLLEGGADVDAQNFHGETPLHLAAAYGRVGLSQVLLEAGGNRSIVSAKGLTPFDIVCKRRRVDECEKSDIELLKDLLTTVMGRGPPKQNFPYVASIRNSSGAHHCAGILVKKDWVLTLASCVTFMTDVHLGVKEMDEEGEVRVPRDVIRQNSTDGDSPLALLQLPSDSAFDPVLLVTDPEIAPAMVDNLALQVGMGVTIHGPREPPQATQLAFWPSEDCGSMWPGVMQPDGWCAYGFAQQCSDRGPSGDKGSPLIATVASSKEQLQPILLGIVADGNLCQTNRSIPAVFANLTGTPTTCWILESIQDPLPTSCTLLTTERKAISGSSGALSTKTIAAVVVSVVVALVAIVGAVAYARRCRDDRSSIEEVTRSITPLALPELSVPGSPNPLNIRIFPRDGNSPFESKMSSHSPWNWSTGSWPSIPCSVKTLPDNLTVALLGKEIGRGAFSRVEEGRLTGPNGQDERVVVKRLGEWAVDYLDKAVAAIKNELMVLERVPAHPNIIRCFGGNLQCQDTFTEGGTVPDVYIVEELMDTNLTTLIHGPGGSVNGSHRSVNGSHRSRGPDLVFSHLLKIFSGIAAGLEHLHQHNVVHYDLKPANVLLDKDHNVKLADFGCSKMKVQTYVTAGFAGTVMYMAPECWFSNFVPDLRVRFQNIDVYSFGVVMWECITGTRPDSTSMEVWKEDGGIAEEAQTPEPNSLLEPPEAGPHSAEAPGGHNVDTTVKLRFPLSDGLPSELRDLVWSCLAFYNDKRPDCAEIRAKLDEFASASWANSFPSRM